MELLYHVTAKKDMFHHDAITALLDILDDLMNLGTPVNHATATTTLIHRIQKPVILKRESVPHVLIILLDQLAKYVLQDFMVMQSRRKTAKLVHVTQLEQKDVTMQQGNVFANQMLKENFVIDALLIIMDSIHLPLLLLMAVFHVNALKLASLPLAIP